ncbi:origin recognition complex subunit 4 isoform 1 [Galdieria sulphuraria]|uniref:Origin recognition complex subunit 4 isoform 1 n=1 Tax=Galdieria sulphuraria TaxID=130081 RepID=M2VW69_GALSU|nr:origin recognition complex subunit 4 isoform 1 [Galdieria sulphuraria]EME27486.1 origin recognition complex subunit 4 isoform 1 [Galdieria sulphuraria]|eukprot:XP_005704006.1 origin recognition complex subunit 4 isoform 1 [Galdieria sulphuraria]
MQLRNRPYEPHKVVKPKQRKTAKQPQKLQHTSKKSSEFVSNVAVSLKQYQCIQLQQEIQEYLLNKLCQTKLTTWEDRDFLSISKTIETLLRNPAPQGESIILIGSAGSGKKILVEETLQRVQVDESIQNLKVIRLYGAVHALREGPMKETHVQLKNSLPNKEVEESTPEDDLLEPTSEDTLTTYLFLLYDFEYFIREKNQSFIYRIFESFQRNRIRGVVLATSQQHDIVDSLEKRIKSRFSHRIYYMPALNDIEKVLKILESLLCIDCDAPSSIETIKQAFNQQISKFVQDTEWNHILENFLGFTPNVSSFLSLVFYIITNLSLDEFGVPKFDLDIIRHGSCQLKQSVGRMQMLKNLSVLEVALLSSLCRLTCRSMDKNEKERASTKLVAFSFERIYQEYLKNEFNSDSATFTTDSYKRPIAWKAFSRLLDLQLIRFQERHIEGRNAMELQPAILVISPEELSQVLE